MKIRVLYRDQLFYRNRHRWCKGPNWWQLRVLGGWCVLVVSAGHKFDHKVPR